MLQIEVPVCVQAQRRPLNGDGGGMDKKWLEKEKGARGEKRAETGWLLNKINEKDVI